jgi:sugar phosphate permease
MIMFGALGAVTATSPADLVLASIGWRGLFTLLAIVTAGCAVMIYLVVPEAIPRTGSAANARLQSVYTDPGFWRLAPLSATSIGTTWALHGLWAAQWLTDIDKLSRTELVQHLFAMAVTVCLAALAFGIAADRLRKRGIGPQALFGVVATASMAAQLALILQWSLPSYVLWAIIAAAGAATVLSYAALGEHFTKELAGRANGLLNFFHVGAAFAVQAATGLVLQQWTPDGGHYPLIAYQSAFALNLGLQVLAGIWFCIPWVWRFANDLRDPSCVPRTCKIRQVPP